MWPQSFDDRLCEWFYLRQSFDKNNVELSLSKINNWWWRYPMVNKLIAWENYLQWPDPWTLLSNNGICGLARALGIVYTLLLIDESLKDRLIIVQDQNDNLVLVDNGKYILNWSPSDLLNIQSININQSKQLTGGLLYSLIGAKE
jgi:hypothetical protein